MTRVLPACKLERCCWNATVGKVVGFELLSVQVLKLLKVKNLKSVRCHGSESELARCSRRSLKIAPLHYATKTSVQRPVVFASIISDHRYCNLILLNGGWPPFKSASRSHKLDSTDTGPHAPKVLSDSEPSAREGRGSEGAVVMCC